MLSLLSAIRSGNIMLVVILVLSRMFVVFCCTPVHEFSHAYVANELGDDTARLQGRMTINPFAHFDLIGGIMILLFGIGYAKPVPINIRHLKNVKRDTALISLAGPVSNLIMAFVYNFIGIALGNVLPVNNIGMAVMYFFTFAAQVNVMLAVFNLLPIPPLDGSKILAIVLPYKTYYKYMQYERYVMIALFVLLFSGVLDIPLNWLVNIMTKLISIIPNLLFG